MKCHSQSKTQRPSSEADSRSHGHVISSPTNKNKLNDIHIYRQTTTVFLVVCLLILRHNYMFRSSMLAIYRLYMRNLSISHTNVCGEFTGCGVGWGAISRFVLEKRAWTSAV